MLPQDSINGLVEFQTLLGLAVAFLLAVFFIYHLVDYLIFCKRAKKREKDTLE